MNYKRRRHKNARAGCLLCKPYKGNGMCPRHRNMGWGNRRRFEADTDACHESGISSPWVS